MLRFKYVLAVMLNFCLFATSTTAQFTSPAETGPVGVYDDKLHGARTALGALYDKNQMTCAHKFYPTGTLLQISRIDNDQSVMVEVNDRLSVKSDAVVQVSRIASQWLNIDPSRVTIVRIDPLGKPKNEPTAYYNTSPSAVNAPQTMTAKGVATVPQSYDAVVYRQPVPVAQSAPKLQFPTAFGSPAPTSSTPQAYDNVYARRAEAIRPSGTITTRSIPQSYDNLTARGIAANGPLPAPYDAPVGASSRSLATYYVQVAAFSDYANADRYYRDLLRRGVSDVNIMQVQQTDGGTLYRMRAGPFANVAEANKKKQLLGGEYGLRALVVKDK